MKLPKWFNPTTIIYLILGAIPIVLLMVGLLILDDKIGSSLWGKAVVLLCMATSFWGANKILDMIKARMTRKFDKRKAELKAEHDILVKKRQEISARADLNFTEWLDSLPETEISDATRARLKLRIDSIKAGNHRPFDPSELDDSD